MTATAFKKLVAHWRVRAQRIGDAGVGRAGEDHVQQAERIQQQLDDILVPRFYNHILDFGAGWGRFTEWLEQRGSHIWAVDVVAPWLNAVKKRSKTLTAIQLDSPILPLDSNSIDLVVDIMTLQSIEDMVLWSQCTGELRRVAAPGATMVSLHKAESRTPSMMATALGLEPTWTAFLTANVDEADEMYYFLVGRRANYAPAVSRL